MKIPSRIRQGVSLYSFNERYVERPEYGITDMMSELSSLGVSEFEIVGSIVFDEYPRPRPSEIDEVLQAAAAAGQQPFSYGGYVDYGRIPGHVPVDEDYLVDITADLMTARDLGCTFVRETNIPNHLLQRTADLAERFGIAVGIEVHAPSKPSDARIQEQLAAIDLVDSPLVGFIPDFGCFTERPAAPGIISYIERGAHSDLIDYIIEHRHDGLTEEQMQVEIAKRGGGEIERFAVSDMFGWLSFGPADIEGFETLLPRSLYFHSKFYHVTAEIEDPSLPLPTLLDRIEKSGFSGVLMSEYEGHAFHNDDAHEQLERHLELERRILTAL